MGKVIGRKTSKTGRNDPCPCGSRKKFKKCHGATPISSPSGPKILEPYYSGQHFTPTPNIKTDYKKLGESQYNTLPEYERTRVREFSEIYSDDIKLIEDYERLVCRMIVMLGEILPKDNLDRCIRDLICDVFDVLYAGKSIILRNYYPLGFPLLRRAYETVCLIHYFQLTPSKADKWDKGHQFDNSAIRKFLNTHPMGEKEDELRQIYTFYTKGTHVNRDFIPVRHLGEGNQFTLGSISRPDLFVTTDYIEQIIRLWFWFVAIVAYHYRETFSTLDANFGKDYLAIANRAQSAMQSLHEEKIKIREVNLAEEKQHGK